MDRARGGVATPAPPQPFQLFPEMKAIYINLDPYLAAFAAWLKANPADPDTGERATPPPHFDPLPLAVTIPLGETAAIFKEAAVDSGDWYNVFSTVDGVLIGVKATSLSDPLPGEAGVIATDVVPGLSAITPEAKYGVFAVDGDTTVSVAFNDGDNDFATIDFPVLVQFEKASGPVDLVDFTPPAAAPTLTATAINTALGGSGAQDGSPLAGVDIKLTKYNGFEVQIGEPSAFDSVLGLSSST